MDIQLKSNRKISINKTGTGPIKLLMVPGGPGLTKEYLQPIHKRLPKDEFTVISYDPSGYTNSNSDYYPSIGDYSKELNEVIEIMDFHHCHLLGQSWGCVVVIDYLCQYPEFNGKVILSNGFYSGEQLKGGMTARMDQLPAEFQEKRRELAETGNLELVGELMGQYWLPNHVIRGMELPESLLIGIGNFGQSEIGPYYIGPHIFDLSGALSTWDRQHELNQMKQDFLLISGKYDYLDREENEKLAKAIPNSRLWISEIASHMPMFEDPDEYLKEIINFLK